MKRRLAVALAAAFMVIATMPAAGGPAASVRAAVGCATDDNLVQNCGFESGLASWTASEPDNTATVTEIPVSGGTMGPEEGTYAFAGSTDPESTTDVATLTQTFTPLDGVAYRASVWYAGGDATSQHSWLEATITFGSTTADLAYLYGGGYANDWNEEWTAFVGTGEEATLTISYYDPTDRWYLDNIAVVPFTPAAPVMNSGMAQAPGEIGMNWIYPDYVPGLDVLGFNVYMGTAAGAEDATPLNGDSLVTDNVFAQEGLTGGQTYYFTVTAVYAGYGESAPSNEIEVTAIDVPGAPTDVQAVAGDGSVTLSWTPPANDGGEAINYYYIYVGTSADSLNWWDMPSATEGNEYTIRNLENGQQYWFAVSAGNSDAGEGALSEVVSATPTRSAFAPSAPVLSIDSVGNGWITVSWTEPDDGGSAITGYGVYACESSGPCGNSRLSSPLGPTDRTFTIDSLQQNGTTYYVTVTAINDIGESDPSNEVAAMPLLVPDAPTDVSAQATLVGKRGLTATVTWTDGASSVVDSHTVYVYAYTAGTKKNPAPKYRLLASYVAGAGTSYQVSGLSSGKEYAFSVSAHNPAGWSSESAKSAPVP